MQQAKPQIMLMTSTTFCCGVISFFVENVRIKTQKVKDVMLQANK